MDTNTNRGVDSNRSRRLLTSVLPFVIMNKLLKCYLQSTTTYGRIDGNIRSNISSKGEIDMKFVKKMLLALTAVAMMVVLLAT